MEDAIIQYISNLGFPIAVSLFFMFRMDKTLKDQTRVFQELTEVIRKKLK